MTRSDEFAAALERDGFVMVPDVVPHADLDAMYDVVEALMSARGHAVPAGGSRDADGFVHAGMIGAAEKHPNDLRFTYNAIDFAPAFWRLLTGPTVIETARRLTHAQRPEQVLVNNTNVRIDAPENERQRIDWHQDYPYIHTDSEPQFSVTVWIPFERCGPEHGVLEVAKGSHREGILQTVAVPKEHSNRDDHVIPESTLDRYEHCQVEVPRGGALFMHINTVHRSGRNTSDRIRYTAIGRYHNAAAMDVLVDYRRPARPIALQTS